MSTTLYLRSTTWATNQFYLETTNGTANQSLATNTADAAEVQWTNGAGGAAVEWCSRPVTAAVTLSATMTISVNALESNMSANAGMRCRLFKVSNNRATWTEMGGGPFDDNVELGTTVATMAWDMTPTTNNSLSVGERLGIRLYIDDNCGSAQNAGYTATLQFDGASTYVSYLYTVDTMAFNLSVSTTQAVTAADATPTVTRPDVRYSTSKSDAVTVAESAKVVIPLASRGSDAATVGESVTPRLKAWYQPNALTVNTGAVTSGTVESAWADDGTILQLTEVTGTPAFSYDFSFTDVVEGRAQSVRFVGYYEGNVAHEVWVRQYNFDSTNWEDLVRIPSSASEGTVEHSLISGGGSYWSSGEIRLRIIHTSAGNPIHVLYIDAFTLTSMPVVHLDEAVTVGDSANASLTTIAPSTFTVDVSDGATVGEGGTLWFDEQRAIRVLDTASVSLATVAPSAYTIEVTDGVTVGTSAKAVVDPVAVHASESVTIAETVKAVVDPVAIHATESVTAAEGTPSLTLLGVGAKTIDVTDPVTVGQVAKAVVDPVAIHASDALVVAESVRVVVDPVAIHASETLTVTETPSIYCGAVILMVTVTDPVTVGERRYVTVYHYPVILAVDETLTVAQPFNQDFHAAQPVDATFTVAEPFNQGFVGEHD